MAKTGVSESKSRYRRSVARHEATHCVTAIALGAKVHFVCFLDVYRPSGFTGDAETSDALTSIDMRPVNKVYGDKAFFAHLVRLCAPYFLGKEKDASGCDEDLETAACLLDDYVSSGQRSSCHAAIKAEVLRLFSIPKNRRALRLVTKTLIEKGVVFEEEINEIYRNAERV
jgi:hypothetical protein